ncbi:recombinase family protein [Stomatobaculum longum]|uniref:recombinase family protein n=1 Tax=Stomatobaculum longum TaxID=796942 RepID=UPI002804A1A6|nr:recombinase family protein [Stomatobaculum longum]
MTHTPYGYRIENAAVAIDEPAAEKIRQLYREYLECGSMRAAAMKVRIDKTHSVIGRLLKNKIYLGTDYYPQIVDEEIFEKVQGLRGSNARSQNRIREYEAPLELELKNYKLGKVEEKYTDPYKQAEYAYSMIEEEHNE